jgi:hypothetical protein
MNDDETTLTVVRGALTRVRDSLGGVHMGVPAGEIVGRARRRRLAVAGAAGAACAALGLALALVLPSAGPPRGVHVHLAAWSVDTNGNGTVTITVHQVQHLALLRRALTEAGVPAVIELNNQCWTAREFQALGGTAVVHTSRTGVVIRPSALRPGTEVAFSIYQIVDRHGRPLPAGFLPGLVRKPPPRCPNDGRQTLVGVGKPGQTAPPGPSATRRGRRRPGTPQPSPPR